MASTDSVTNDGDSKSNVNGSETSGAGGGVLNKTGGGLLSKAGTVPGSSGDQKSSVAAGGLLAKAGAKEDSAVGGGGKTAAGDTSSEDSRAAKRRALGHPDPDTIKMFAGQIPRRMDETELRAVFEEFGPVYQLNILRERGTNQSRGCCFVTYFARKSALEAQNKLHNLRTLPSMHHPMQMKPADAENRSERKLFVGMIGKEADDEAVWSMFEKFGPIEECAVLRDQKNTSKGCAFVTFMSRHNAIAAIRGLHHSKTMENCSAPLVVKFADTTRERPPLGIGRGGPMANNNQPPMQRTWGNNNSGGGSGGGGSWGGQQQQQPPPLQQQQQQNQNQSMANMMNPLMNPQAMALLQQLSQAATQLSSLANNSGMPNAPPPNRFGMPPPSNSGMGQQGNFNNQGGGNNPAGALAMMLQAAGMSRPGGNNFQTPPPGNFGNNPGNNFGNNSGGGNFGSNSSGNNFGPNNGSGGGNFNSGGGNFNIPPPSQFPLAQPANNNTPLGRQVEGPDGCNLFIYHLPQQCNDADLADMFSPFGNVISAKVFLDKVTGASKCFGFVSYDNQASAEAAIQGMNSFLIGSKRLKVQPKRTLKDLGPKPY